jgi:hypothetical protein
MLLMENGVLLVADRPIGEVVLDAPSAVPVPFFGGRGAPV